MRTTPVMSGCDLLQDTILTPWPVLREKVELVRVKWDGLKLLHEFFSIHHSLVGLSLEA